MSGGDGGGEYDSIGAGGAGQQYTTLFDEASREEEENGAEEATRGQGHGLGHHLTLSAPSLFLGGQFNSISRREGQTVRKGGR